MLAFAPIVIAQAMASAAVYAFSTRANEHQMLGGEFGVLVRELERLALTEPDNGLLQHLDSKLYWFFSISMEAGLVTLFAALALAGSAVFTMAVFLYLCFRQSRAPEAQLCIQADR